MQDKKEFNYYESQLSKLKPESEFPTSIKIFDGEGNQTNQMDLNAESIPVLIEFLNKKLTKAA